MDKDHRSAEQKELDRLRAEIASVRALAKTWEKASEKLYADTDAMRDKDADTEALADVGEARAEECDAHARAIFDIVGKG